MSNSYEQMHEALESLMTDIGDYATDGLISITVPIRGDTVRKIKSAVALHPRNCDVGTAEEQERRYEKFCDSHKWVDDGGVNACSPQCPLYKELDCALNWAQMPYEAKERDADNG